jgi:hypothetical protein
LHGFVTVNAPTRCALQDACFHDLEAQLGRERGAGEALVHLFGDCTLEARFHFGVLFFCDSAGLCQCQFRSQNAVKEWRSYLFFLVGGPEFVCLFAMVCDVRAVGSVFL